MSKNNNDQIDYGADFGNLIDLVIRTLATGPGGYQKQYVLNSDDAGAEHIWETIEGRGASYSWSITDDGEGMGPAGIKRFFSMAKKDLANLDLKKHGQQNLGAKSGMAVCKWMELIDFSDKWGDKKARVIKINCDRWRNHLAGDETLPLTPVVKNLKPETIGLPANSTGVRVRMWEWRGTGVTANTRIKTAALHLAPWVASKIAVNGKPIHQREIIGEQMYKDYPDTPHGLVRVRLYAPVTVTPGEYFFIGSHKEELIRWSVLWQLIVDRYIGKYPQLAELDTPSICGGIYYPPANNFRDIGGSINAGDFIESQELEDLIELMLCDDGVLDWALRSLGSVEETRRNKYDEDVIREAMASLSCLGGPEQRIKNEPVPAPIKLSVRSIELKFGDEFDVSIVEHDPDIKEFKWELCEMYTTNKVATNVCRTRQLRGMPLARTVVAGSKQSGAFHLVVSNVDDPTQFDRIPVSVISQQTPYVTPRHATVVPGGEVRLTMKNFKDATSGNFRWLTDELDVDGRFVGDKGRLVQSYTGISAVYRAPTELAGEFDRFVVTATDAKNRRLLFDSTITVKPKNLQPGGGEGEALSCTIDGVTYRVDMFDRNPDSALSKVTVAADGANVIVFNRNHLVLVEKRKKSKAVVVEFVIGQCLDWHLKVLYGDEDLSAETCALRKSELWKQIAQAVQDKAKAEVSA